MTLSIWRYAHLFMAIVSSLFLGVLSATGVILAIDAIVEKYPDYRVKNLEALSLAEVVPTLQELYPEVISLAVDHNGFVLIDAIDEGGNAVRGFVDANTGKMLGPIAPKSSFVQGVTTLHRSLFLHETGRIIVGITSFLLLLITVSGLILLLKRQQGLRHLFAKIKKDSFAQHFHVWSGGWSVLPLLFISLTGTYLFMSRMGLFSEENTVTKHGASANSIVAEQTLDNFPVFRQTSLADVEKLEFPFVEGDPEEFFILKLKDVELTIDQLTGKVVREAKSPYHVLLEKWSLDLHSGRTSIMLAIVLGLASLHILFLIYSGFSITFKRTRVKIKNIIEADRAEIILLVGSENGSTLFFANQVLQQLLQAGQRAFVAEMNSYKNFPCAEKLIVFTATFGLGDAPTNARRFLSLLKAHPQDHPVQFAVLGFGSRTYSHFCGYASLVDTSLAEQKWAVRQLPLYTINDRSADEFVQWTHAWSEATLLRLATSPAVYAQKIGQLQDLQVVDKTDVGFDNQTFMITLALQSRKTFQSGDLLAIYPNDKGAERFYSIGKHFGNVRLIVKLHEQGIGSSYLYRLQVGQSIRARVVKNLSFHFPKKASRVLMICNGTGIAPFLGMVNCNRNRRPIYLYAGFRYRNSLAVQYQRYADDAIRERRLTSFAMAFSREESPQYVMDLVRRDAVFISDVLRRQGVVMICGSLSMQKDVESLLDEIVLPNAGLSLASLKENGQLLTDCY